MNFAARRRLTVLRESFQLCFDELTEGTILEALNDGPGTEDAGIENSPARNDAPGFVNFTK
jgi:hypothetical protein